MSDSRQTTSHNQLSDLSSRLMLVDDDLFDFSACGDLYEQLVREPSFVKKESLKYDYTPNLGGLYMDPLPEAFSVE